MKDIGTRETVPGAKHFRPLMPATGIREEKLYSSHDNQMYVKSYYPIHPSSIFKNYAELTQEEKTAYDAHYPAKRKIVMGTPSSAVEPLPKSLIGITDGTLIIVKEDQNYPHEVKEEQAAQWRAGWKNLEQENGPLTLVACADGAFYQCNNNFATENCHGLATGKKWYLVPKKALEAKQENISAQENYFHFCKIDLLAPIIGEDTKKIIFDINRDYKKLYTSLHTLLNLQGSGAQATADILRGIQSLTDIDLVKDINIIFDIIEYLNNDEKMLKSITACCNNKTEIKIAVRYLYHLVFINKQNISADSFTNSFIEFKKCFVTLLAAISDLKEYGVKLEREYDKDKDPLTHGKAEAIKKLVAELNAVVANPYDLPTTEGFNKVLHNQERNDLFKEHRGWKRVIANIALAFAGLGIFYAIAGLIHKARTGHFLFFNETTTQEKVHNIEEKWNSVLKK